MKPLWKIAITLILVASVTNSIILLWPAPAPDPVSLNEKYRPELYYRVPYDYAKTCIDNYKQKFFTDSTVLSFTIDRQDFLQAIQMETSTITCPVTSKYEYARGYIGYDTVANLFHIFFTPVVGVKTDSTGNIVDPGKDVILTGKYQNKDRQSGMVIPNSSQALTDEGPYMLDLNAPCPTTCGTGSMTAFAHKR